MIYEYFINFAIYVSADRDQGARLILCESITRNGRMDLFPERNSNCSPRRDTRNDKSLGGGEESRRASGREFPESPVFGLLPHIEPSLEIRRNRRGTFPNLESTESTFKVEEKSRLVYYDPAINRNIV
jgi:hypothetical protein